MKVQYLPACKQKKTAKNQNFTYLNKTKKHNENKNTHKNHN